jgi:hypothetical protein
MMQKVALPQLCVQQMASMNEQQQNLEGKHDCYVYSIWQVKREKDRHALGL